jgi:isoamyl acetate esterase
MPRPLLLLLGDSLTEKGSDCSSDGWICLLLTRFHRAADIAQRGMSGYSTQYAFVAYS